MANAANMKVIISGIDNLSPLLKSINKNLGAWERQAKAIGKGGLPMGIAAGAGAALAVKSFREAEDAAIQLQNTMMLKGGEVPALFQGIIDQANQLGAKLPGATADFEKMAAQLRGLGVADKTIAGGALEATAKLGVVTKPLGESYESAAEAMAKFAQSLGIADKDMVPFADTVQRAAHLGAKLQDMQYAIARAGAPMQAMGQSGLKAANDLVPLISMLIRTGMSGEEAGTGIKKLIEVFTIHGKFTTIPQMVKDLEKFYNADKSHAMENFTKAFGAEHAAKALAIAQGGYKEITQEMANQASLNARIGNSLNSLSNKMENLGGNAENLAASVGKVWSPEMKKAADAMAGWIGKMDEWVKANPQIVKTMTAIAGALVGVKIAATATAVALGALRFATMLGPVGLWVNLLAAGAALIITNWDKVGPYFERIKKGLSQIPRSLELMATLLSLRYIALLGPVGMLVGTLATGAALVIAHWDKIGPWFEGLLERIKKGIDNASQDFKDMLDGLPKLWEDASAAIFQVWDAMGRKWDEMVKGWHDSIDWMRGLVGLSPVEWNAPQALPPMPEKPSSGVMDWLKSWVGTAPAQPQAMPDLGPDIAKLAEGAQKLTNVDANLIKAVIAAESGGNPKAFSEKGAKGLMQLMPKTAERFGVFNAWDPGQNVLGGAKYLKFLLDKFRGNEPLAIAAYNAGEGNVDKYGGIPPFKETREYTDKVLNFLRQQRLPTNAMAPLPANATAPLPANATAPLPVVSGDIAKLAKGAEKLASLNIENTPPINIYNSAPSLSFPSDDIAKWSDGAEKLTRFLRPDKDGEATVPPVYPAWNEQTNQTSGIAPLERPGDYNTQILDYLLQDRQRQRGAVDVNFNNAPPGMRVEPKKGNTLDITPNVGYRSLGPVGIR